MGGVFAIRVIGGGGDVPLFIGFSGFPTKYALVAVGSCNEALKGVVGAGAGAVVDGRW